MKNTHFFRKGDKVRIKTLDELINEWDGYQTLRITNDELIAHIDGRVVTLFRTGQETNYGGKTGVISYAGYLEHAFVKIDNYEDPVEFSTHVLELVEEEKEELLELPSLPDNVFKTMETVKEIMEQFGNIEQLVAQTQEMVKTLEKPTYDNEAYLRGYREGLNEGRKRAFEEMSDFAYEKLDKIIYDENQGEME